MSHHLHLRKRGARGLEPFPARSSLLRLLDRIVLVVGVLGPLMTIPQILKIFLLQDAAGVSVISWGTFALFDIPWILYGLIHHDRPIFITYILWIFMNSIVVLGALMYGAGLF